MFDLGLVFNVRFDEEELRQLPSWSLFNQKITDGVNSLPGRIMLPPRPSNMNDSVNATLWTFVKCFSQAVRGQKGRRSYSLVPPEPTPTYRWTLDLLREEFAVLNPISGLDDTPVPQQLVIIGTSLQFSSNNYLYLTPRSSSFPWVCYRSSYQY